MSIVAIIDTLASVAAVRGRGLGRLFPGGQGLPRDVRGKPLRGEDAFYRHVQFARFLELFPQVREDDSTLPSQGNAAMDLCHKFQKHLNHKSVGQVDEKRTDHRHNQKSER